MSYRCCGPELPVSQQHFCIEFTHLCTRSKFTLLRCQTARKYHSLPGLIQLSLFIQQQIPTNVISRHFSDTVHFIVIVIQSNPIISVQNYSNSSKQSQLKKMTLSPSGVATTPPTRQANELTHVDHPCRASFSPTHGHSSARRLKWNEDYFTLLGQLSDDDYRDLAG